jgi:hypothetical protein
VKTFPRQLRTVGCVVFYAIRVVSKESRRFVLPRTSCSSLLFEAVSRSCIAEWQSDQCMNRTGSETKRSQQLAGETEETRELRVKTAGWQRYVRKRVKLWEVKC